MSSSGSLALNFLLTPVHLSHKTRDDAGSAPASVQVCGYGTAELPSEQGLTPPHPLSALSSAMGFTFPVKNQALGGNTAGWIAGSKWQGWQGEGKGIFH